MLLSPMPAAATWKDRLLLSPSLPEKKGSVGEEYYVVLAGGRPDPLPSLPSSWDPTYLVVLLCCSEGTA
jgi:hypothetical protein